MQIVKNHWLWVVLLMLGMSLGWWFIYNAKDTALVTTTADIGTVTSFISVSGSATVDDIIPLSFPKGGTVSGVFVSRGDAVATGTILATVGDAALQAEYAAALAEVTRARANRDELLRGQTGEEAVVTETTIASAETALTNTINTAAARVEAARTTLYSTGLTAVAQNVDIESPAPVVSGSYTCTDEGAYIIELYRSNTLSGYSYRYSGIETGVDNASTNQSSPLGTCGLRLQFTDGANYNNAVFTLTIPNTASPTYSTNRALYDQTLIQEEANRSAAQQALELALNQGLVATAGPRVERLIAANASVAAAEARLSNISYLLSESALRAPVAGIITSLDVVVGQTLTATPVITLFAPRQTIVTARIPEKDIARLSNNQSAQIFFDANPDETVYGTISFLSPIQTVFGGIPYYEALIELNSNPVWIRSGMQADVQITITELTDVVRFPRLYLVEGHVDVKSGDTITKIRPEILLIGSDGYVAVTGISAGSELALPTN